MRRLERAREVRASAFTEAAIVANLSVSMHYVFDNSDGEYGDER